MSEPLWQYFLINPRLHSYPRGHMQTFQSGRLEHEPIGPWLPLTGVAPQSSTTSSASSGRVRPRGHGGLVRAVCSAWRSSLWVDLRLPKAAPWPARQSVRGHRIRASACGICRCTAAGAGRRLQCSSCCAAAVRAPTVPRTRARGACMQTPSRPARTGRSPKRRPAARPARVTTFAGCNSRR